MKASEIKAVITARPDAVFIARDYGRVRIAEVIETDKQVLTNNGYQNRTQVKYLVDRLVKSAGFYHPANPVAGVDEFERAPEAKVWKHYERLLPQAIIGVCDTTMTLEELGEAWLVEAQETHERNKQERNERKVLVDELMAITGISRHVLNKTDDEVLAFISKAVKQSATV